MATSKQDSEKHYRAEFSRTFAALGSSYVTAATELALLIADTKDDLMEDWLDGMMEHQNLGLNRLLAEMQATDAEIDRLYRGHYAAMLASLSSHRKGIRTRPEILIYDVLCDLEGSENRLKSTSDPFIIGRREREVSQLGQIGQRVILAII